MKFNNTKIELFDNSGIDDKYYQYKDLLIHSILKPVFELKYDDENIIYFFTGQKTNELLKKYNQKTINKLDKIYNKMLKEKLAYFLKPASKNIKKLAVENDFFEDAIFTVFKDDLLNTSPLVTAEFDFIDPVEFALSELN